MSQSVHSTQVNIFERASRPSERLFETRSDMECVADMVGREREEYNAAQTVLLGVPVDEGVVRNFGRPGARLAPHEVRKQLLAMPAPDGLDKGQVFDLGDTVVGDTLEKTHDLQRELVRQVLADGKGVVIVGGGNDISYPDCAALSDVSSDVMALNIDTHFDVRACKPRNSGTPYRQLLEGGHVKPSRFYEIANKALNNPIRHRRYLEDLGVNIIPLRALRDQRITPPLESALARSTAETIFWGVDIDSVRVSDAPGVSAPCPIGLTADEICDIARLAGGDPRSRILELTEINPVYDADKRTSRLAAYIILYYLTEHLQLPRVDEK